MTVSQKLVLVTFFAFVLSISLPFVFLWYGVFATIFLGAMSIYGQGRFLFFWYGLAYALSLELLLGYGFGSLSLPYSLVFLILHWLGGIINLKSILKSHDILSRLLSILAVFASSFLISIVTSAKFLVSDGDTYLIFEPPFWWIGVISAVIITLMFNFIFTNQDG